MWRERIQELDPEVRFSEPASVSAVEQASRELAAAIPDELASLLSETNGVADRYGAGLIWPIERIVEDNQRFRTSFGDIYMSFDSLLFFADAGNGDQFAFSITTASVRDDVFVWDHESDSRRWYAGSLAQYLEWWLSGNHPV